MRGCSWFCVLKVSKRRGERGEGLSFGEEKKKREGFEAGRMEILIGEHEVSTARVGSTSGGGFQP